MTEQDQIKALAELDGFKDCKLSLCYYTTDDPSEEGKPIKPYLTSYDAIIPLIQKLREDTWSELFDCMSIIVPPCECGQHWSSWVLDFTPTQLCEALLRATGKWKDL